MVSPGDPAVLLDTVVTGLPLFRSKRLLVTADAVSFGSRSVRLADVTGVAYWVVVQTVNGVEANVRRYVRLTTAASHLTVVCPTATLQRRAPRARVETTWIELVRLCDDLVRPRLVATAMAVLTAGGAVAVGGVTVRAHGMEVAGRGRTTRAYGWDELEQVDAAAGFLTVHVRGEPAPVARVRLREANAVLLPEVLAEAAATFEGA
jgi:hypothetical protein